MHEDEKRRLVLLAGLARGLQALYETNEREEILRICAFCDRLIAQVAGTAACRADWREAQYDLLLRADEDLFAVVLHHVLRADNAYEEGRYGEDD